MKRSFDDALAAKGFVLNGIAARIWDRWKAEWRVLVALLGGFGLLYYLPIGAPRFEQALVEALALAQWYAREHVLLCLVPAFFIAGGVAVFLSQASVMRYLGAQAPKVLAYGVASVSGTVLAVCSCTVLPLFAGIYRMGAGLGPAVAFLYSGPAINVLAIVLTANVLGLELGLARAVGAIAFSIVIGLAMQFLFRQEVQQPTRQVLMSQGDNPRPLWQTALVFGAMIGILVFANWGRPPDDGGLWMAIYHERWLLTAVLAVLFGGVLISVLRLSWWQVGLAAGAVIMAWLLVPDNPVVPFVVGLVGLVLILSPRDDEGGEWLSQSWGFAKQILPLLLAGVLLAGFLLGRPGHEGLIPSAWVSALVGGNSLTANLTASVLGAFMYFATLTEVPIVQGLLGSGMGKGPALALLLAGPALSLPNMLVIRSVLGTKKTAVFVSLVIAFATVSGLIYGAL
jgi:uncharacterized membrane protein YraQ (UPF0718 family)